MNQTDEPRRGAIAYETEGSVCKTICPNKKGLSGKIACVGSRYCISTCNHYKAHDAQFVWCELVGKE